MENDLTCSQDYSRGKITFNSQIRWTGGPFFYFEGNCKIPSEKVFLRRMKWSGLFQINEMSNINTDVIQDPTMPRSEDHPCPRCRHRESVFFQSDTKKAAADMRLYYVCTNTNCCHRWSEQNKESQPACPLLLSSRVPLSVLNQIKSLLPVVRVPVWRDRWWALPATWWGAASGKTDTDSTYLITNYTATQNRTREDEELMDLMEVEERISRRWRWCCLCCLCFTLKSLLR